AVSAIRKRVRIERPSRDLDVLDERDPPFLALGAYVQPIAQGIAIGIDAAPLSGAQTSRPDRNFAQLAPRWLRRHRVLHPLAAGKGLGDGLDPRRQLPFADILPLQRYGQILNT